VDAARLRRGEHRSETHSEAPDQRLAAGDVLLMHDSAPVVLAVLPALLDRLSARGLKAVSLVSACASEPGE